jgi:hypothetical protein
MWVAVHTHKGLDIKAKTPAEPVDFGYIIDHVIFMGQHFRTVKEATDAIDTEFKTA